MREARFIALFTGVSFAGRARNKYGIIGSMLKPITTSTYSFPEHIAALAGAQGLTPEGAFAKLEELYDGFRFHPKAERVFNPVSVGKCLSQLEFGNYWFETGTPTFLVEQLKRNPIEPGEMSVTTFDLSASYEPEQVWLLPLMVQTGYLTIKSSRVAGDETVCELGYPNREVEVAMSKYLSS